MKDARIRESLLKETKRKISESIGEDNMICQAINSVQELTRTANTVAKRMREWFSLFWPEKERDVANNEKLASEIAAMEQKDICSEMGGKLGADDLMALKEQAKLFLDISKVIEKHEIYLESVMKRCCPDLLAVAGVKLGAQLIEHAGSLRNLAVMTASTIQMIGAEKALFRHLRTGAKTPKHGIILQHQFVQKAKSKGKAARVLADKISIAVRVDYFKGEAVAERLIKELESKKL